MLGAALVKLTFIQGVDAHALASVGMEQRETTTKLYPVRGSIADRNGTQLAFTVEGRAVAGRPQLFTDDPAGKPTYDLDGDPRAATTADQKRQQVADILVQMLGAKTASGTGVDRAEVLTRLRDTSKKYVYLARGLMPAQADAVMDRIGTVLPAADIDAVALERQDLRQTPDGDVAAPIVGSTGWGGVGASGIEAWFEKQLAGSAGSRVQQVDQHGRPIPGTVSDDVPAVDGTDLTLTLDADLQYTTERMLAAQVEASKAVRGCIVVKGISDGQIYSMACYQPGKTTREVGNLAISAPIEPGSVNKVVTFAAAIERGLIKPDTVLHVKDNILMGGHVVHDAWGHDPVDMTATGVLAKSSNVGTLMIAQKLGEDAFAQELTRFGLGRKTGIELPGESSGQVPKQSQWSATSFANLPIGQGLSMTLLQLVDMYQAIGNKGVMIAPTVVKSRTTDGVTTATTPRVTGRVMSAGTASTLLTMLKATVQGGSLAYDGTGARAAIQGYQVAGKTGTAQQVDPKTGGYSRTKYNATFAGIVPADNPRFAIAVWMDAPQVETEGGGAAAPLFHDVASYALRAESVPPSKEAAPVVPLYLNLDR
ncbi:peptidoglycan D,D-transpeptidase FtsI family protein [Nakamurella endophytica]|nr:penicillin-binding protein 2 [Nakamurella endophytica]